jgi:hypothetical protein
VCWKREYLRVIGGQARLTGSDLLAMNVETGQLAHRELRADVAVELNAMFSIAARSWASVAAWFLRTHSRSGSNEGRYIRCKSAAPERRARRSWRRCPWRPRSTRAPRWCTRPGCWMLRRPRRREALP